MRPEHLHYDKVEAWFRESIAQGREFLFDTVSFDIELRRLWEEYNFPYEVRTCITGMYIFVCLMVECLPNRRLRNDATDNRAY